MGQRGPKPKHPALKLVGGRGAAPGRKTGRVRKGAPSRPAWLVGEAAAEWDRLAPELDAAGLLAVVDTGILAAYCVAVADLKAATAEIEKNGRCYLEAQQTSKGQTIGHRPRENPAVKHADSAARRIEKLGAALGLTPAARSRLESDAADAPSSEGNKVVAIRERIQQARAGT